MKTRLIGLGFFIGFLILVQNIEAVPAYPYPIKIKQADGTEITVLKHGDEFFHYTATLDGYVLKPDNAGILYYAQFDATGNLQNTSVKANDIEKRSSAERKFVQNLEENPDLSKLNQIGRALRSKSLISATVPQKAYPLLGTPKSLVILVNFSDVKFVTPTPQVAFTNLLNQNKYSSNGGTGSAKDYFHDSSMGVFNPQFDVFGPVTLDNPMAFYGTNDASGNDSNPQQMVIDACTKTAVAGLDFSQYDTDGDGQVDNVFIYYAGYNEAEGGPANSIWPHKWNLNNYNTKFNGVSIFHYACTSELRGNTASNMCGIGTFCHEFGHVLGLDDYYVTSGTDHHTLSIWNIMDYGPYLNLGRTPPAYCAYDRFFLKWLTPTELKVAGNYSLDTLTTSNKAYLISQNGNQNLQLANNPNSPEYFMLENRQKRGWDTYLPGHGMLVYHIFYNQSTWADNSPNNDPNAMGVDIVEADGIAITETNSLDPTLSGDPFPGTSNVTTFNPILRNGTNIKKPLINIKEINGIILFHFGSNIVLEQNLQSFTTVQGTPSVPQTIKVSGTKLKSAINIAFKVGQHYEIKKESDPSTAWGKTITLTPVDSTVSVTNVQIRYNPTVPSYNTAHNDTLVVSTINGDYAEAPLYGTSTRSVYVVPPVASNASNISFTGFIANWNSVYDATGYYFTAYNVSDGESRITEEFDKGIIAPNGWTITPSSISNSTVYSGKKPPAIQFSNTGEYIQTEKYLVPVTKLSFFIRSMAGNNGGFFVQARKDQNSWEKVDSISVSITLNETDSISFSEAKGYNQFLFTYYKGLGSVTFDDVTVVLSKQISYNLRENWITSNSDTLTNLIPNTEYFYKVRASDKSTYYENITDFSNIITVNTTAYPYKTKLVTTVDSNGDVTVLLPSVQTILYIYNLLGQNIKTIVPDNTTVKISDLPKKQVYILKAGNLVTKIVN
jgi:M6 family metalloprotease-like protein